MKISSQVAKIDLFNLCVIEVPSLGRARKVLSLNVATFKSLQKLSLLAMNTDQKDMQGKRFELLKGLTHQPLKLAHLTALPPLRTKIR